MSRQWLELVLDPEDAVHRCLADRFEQRLDSDWRLRRTAWRGWTPGPCRSPGSPGQEPVVLLLAPARWLAAHGAAAELPAGVWVVAELAEDAALELGPGTALEAPARGAAASRFGVFSFSGERGLPLRCLVQLTLPSLARWRLHQQRCLLALAEALIWWLDLCGQRQRLLPIAPLPQPLALRAAPPASLSQRLRSRRRWLRGGLQRRWSAWRHSSPPDWQIAIGRIPPGAQTVAIVHRLPPHGRDWFADPFLLADGPDRWLFCERWQAAAGRGVIELFAVRPEGLLPWGTVLEEPFHLSFPRVFRHAGCWWATVESAAAGQVRLYRAERFPTRWRFERVLLSDQPWIDPMLIPADHHNSAEAGWWLLVNSHNLPALPGATAPVLHLFHSPDLLQGTFEPHTASPLQLDSTCGRNGGLLQLDAALLRVGQCTGMDNAYGEAVQVRHIERLDPRTYRETPVPIPWLDGLRRQLRATHLHTLNNAGEWLAVDYIPRPIMHQSAQRSHLHP